MSLLQNRVLWVEDFNNGEIAILADRDHVGLPVSWKDQFGDLQTEGYDDSHKIPNIVEFQE